MSLRAALGRRVRGPYRSLGRLDARLNDVRGRVEHVEARLVELTELLHALDGELRPSLALLREEMAPSLRAVLAEESGNRRRLYELRDSPGYEGAWDEPRPLVSVTIATVGRPDLLRTRSLPSVLGQTYGDLEVIVVGDAAGPETEEAVASFGDARVRYSNLTRRESLPDRRHRWLVGSTHARNEAMRLARGRWVMAFDDDDELHPDAIERLLARACEERAEVAYGRFRGHWTDQVLEAGEFPPRRGEFSWGPAIYHAGLRFLTREFSAGYLDAPGDWYLAERMLRIGVRFAMLDEIVLEVYPSEHSYATGDGVWPGRAQAR